MTYNRTGLTLANGTVTGPLVFELHAGREWGGTGCNTQFNFVRNGTWKITVHYAGAPCSNIRVPVTINQADTPTAAFTFYQTPNFAFEINFSSTVQNADSIYWDFMGLGSSNAANPSFTFPVYSTYNVCLTAFNDCGSSTFCEIVSIDPWSVSENALSQNLKLYPNPNTGRFEMNYHGFADQIQVELMDSRGRVLLTERLASSNGEFKQSYNLNNWAAGVYMLRINSAEGSALKRVIIQ
jgi:hypothetical protein